MNWVTIPAAVSFAIGLVVGARGLKSMRSMAYPQAAISWKQAPLSPWRYETLSSIALAMHTLGLLALTAFILPGVYHSDMFMTPGLSIRSFLLSMLAFFAIIFTPYASGIMLSYHLAQPWITPVSYGIGDEGMLYGGSLIKWQSYSHAEAGPQDGLISLYSSYSPGLRTWVIRPPAGSFVGVLGLIQKNLPSTPRVDALTSWRRSPSVMIMTMAALVVFPLLLALWLWTQNQSWVWIYALAAFLVVQSLGIKLITVFDGRGPTMSTHEVEQK